jgi:hypothetical protein
MNALVWKEWREHRLLLAIFVAWMVGAAVYTVAYQGGWGFRAPVGQFSSWAGLYTICAALILAVRVSQGERAAGTLGFSATLPVSLRQTAVVKIVAAIITLALPVLLGALLLVAAFQLGLAEQAEPRSRPYTGVRLVERPTTTLPVALTHLASVTAIAIFSGVQLLLVVSTIGNWLRSQAQVGFLGAVVLAISFAFSGALWYAAEPNANWQLVLGALAPSSLIVHWGYGDVGGGSYSDHELALYHGWALLLAVPVLLAIGWLFVTQYGQSRKPAEAKVSRRRWLPMPAAWSFVPMRPFGPRSAMIWLELRQSLPLVGFGFLFALVIAVFSATTESRYEGGVGIMTRSALPHTIAIIGMLWGAVVGAGLYSADLGGALGSFWRSRPISPGRWFWCKYFVGLFAVLVVLDGAAIIAGWGVPHALQPDIGMGWSYVACFPILHALFYSLAVLGTCWLRRPVLGGLMAIILYGLLSTAVVTFQATSSLDTFAVYNNMLQAEEEAGIDLTRHHYPLVYGTLVLVSCLSAWMASRLAIPLEPVRRWRLLAT